MKKYVGLTDHPRTSRRDLGNPEDWKLVKEFHSKVQARIWLQKMGADGYEIFQEHDPGWGWGYTFSKPGTEE